jgi:transposase InsO family protein
MSGPAELAGVPEPKRQEAQMRLGYIKESEKFIGAYLAQGGNRGEALAVYAQMQGIGRRTLQRWHQRYRQEGIAGLVDTRGKGDVFAQSISDEAFDCFKEMFLDPRQLSVKTCWQNVVYLNQSQGRGWVVPSLRTLYNIIKQRIPMAVEVLHREGLAAYEAKCAPYIVTEIEKIEPGAVWVGDHHPFDCWVRHRHTWIRPWITTWQDLRSRTQVGWDINAGPNQTTIMRAMKRGIEEFGPPESAKIDNGRDYDSEMWTGTTKARRRAIQKGYLDEPMVAGLYAMLGIGISFAIPYHPQSKPVERFFATIEGQLIKTIKTYCGPDTQRRPEELQDYLKTDKAIAEAYDLEGFTALVDEYIRTVYNISAHAGRGMEGRTPLEVMATRTSRRVVAEGVIDLLLRVWSGNLTIGKNGVQFKGLWFGQYDTELLCRQGRKVRVSYDPDDLRRVYVYDAATMKLITIAEQAKLVGYGEATSEEELREAMAAKNRATRIVKQYKQSRLTAEMDLTTVTLRAKQQAARTRPSTRPGKNRPGKNRPADPAAVTLRPVMTPLDQQIDRHEKLTLTKTVRKAAGAEELTEVINLDLSKLNKKERTQIHLNL